MSPDVIAFGPSIAAGLWLLAVNWLRREPTHGLRHVHIRVPLYPVGHSLFVFVLVFGACLASRYPHTVQFWQFGRGPKLIALAGEVVVDYSPRLKARYGWDDTVVAGYSNDVFAYIPSLRVLKEGGYEGGDANRDRPGPFTAAVERGSRLYSDIAAEHEPCLEFARSVVRAAVATHGAGLSRSGTTLRVVLLARVSARIPSLCAASAVDC